MSSQKYLWCTTRATPVWVNRLIITITAVHILIIYLTYNTDEHSVHSTFLKSLSFHIHDFYDKTEHSVKATQQNQN